MARWRQDLTGSRTEVAQLGAQVHHHDQRMTEVEGQLRDITAVGGSGPGAASNVATSRTLTSDPCSKYSSQK